MGSTQSQGCCHLLEQVCIHTQAQVTDNSCGKVYPGAMTFLRLPPYDMNLVNELQAED